MTFYINTFKNYCVWVTVSELHCMHLTYFKCIILCPMCSFYSQFSLSLKWMFSDGCHQLWLPHYSQRCTVWDRGLLGCQIKGKTFCLSGDRLYLGISAVWTFFFFISFILGFCTYFRGKWSVARKVGVPGLWHGHLSWKSSFQERNIVVL